MRKTLTFLMAGLLGGVAMAQSGIHVQDSQVNGVYVLNKDSVYMACSNVGSGNFRKICLVNPATRAWKYVNNTDYTGYLGDFVMKNSQVGLMYGTAAATVYATSDGWQTRQTTTLPITTGPVSTPTGFAGYKSGDGHMYFSADAMTWTDAGDVGLTSNTAVKVARSYSNTVVFFRPAGLSYKSVNGGQAYSTVTYTPNFSASTFVDFTMLTSDTLFVATYTDLWRSVDAGATWTSHAMPNVGFDHIAKLFVRNGTEVFVYDSDNQNNHKTYFSPDAGATWQTKTATPGYHTFFKMLSISNKVYAWPDCTTSNNGDSWDYYLPEATNTYDKGRDIHFKGNNGISASTVGRVFYSFDKGRSWSYGDTISSYDMSAVKILDNGDYMAVDARSQVFYSSNSGQSWTQKYTNATNIATYKVTQAGNNNTMLLTRSSSPLVSTDHGSTWTPLAIGGGAHTQCLSSGGDIYDATGWFNNTTFQVQGWQINKITTSGATTVVDTFLAASETLVDIEMTGSSTGFLFATDATKATRVYKSTSGFASGSTSLVATIPAVATGTANYTMGKIRIQHFGTDTLYLVGNGNTFYHYSTNGGNTWNLVSTTFNTTYPTLYPSVQKGYFFNQNEYIFTLNNNGGIYMNANGTTGSPVTGVEVYQPLSQQGSMRLYPNPATDHVTVETAQKTGEVMVMDLLGNVVYTGKGNEVNTSLLSSAVYVLRALNVQGSVIAQQKLVISK